MIKKLERTWLFLSIFFILVILVSLSLRPATTHLLSLVVIGLGLAAIITFTVRRHALAYREGRITRPGLVRNIIVDGTGILITMAVVILVTSMVTGPVARAAGKAWGVTAGILSALAMGLAVGFGSGWLVRWMWGKLTGPGRTARAHKAR